MCLLCGSNEITCKKLNSVLGLGVNVMKNNYNYYLCSFLQFLTFGLTWSFYYFVQSTYISHILAVNVTRLFLVLFFLIPCLSIPQVTPT